jgi:WhiB family redox-sensing transcriptional regulator
MLPGVPDHWRAQAACRGQPTVLWFRDGRSASVACEICAGCPVRQECLDYALMLGPQLRGIWGGTVEHQRLVLRRTPG